MKAKLLAEFYRRPVVNQETGRVMRYKTFRKGDVVDLTEDEANSLMRDSFAGRQMFEEAKEEPKSSTGTQTTSAKPATSGNK